MPNFISRSVTSHFHDSIAHRGIGFESVATRAMGAASAYAPHPAPAGYRWDFVTFNSERVTFLGEPVVTLIGA